MIENVLAILLLLVGLSMIAIVCFVIYQIWKD